MTTQLPCGCVITTSAGVPPPVCSTHLEDFTPDHVRKRQGRN